MLSRKAATIALVLGGILFGSSGAATAAPPPGGDSAGDNRSGEQAVSHSLIGTRGASAISKQRIANALDVSQAGLAQTGGVMTKLPSASGDTKITSVVATSGQSVTITPQSVTTSHRDGRAVVMNSVVKSSKLVAQATDSGGVQIIETLADQSAANAFTFSVDVAGGANLALRADGGIDVSQNGKVVGALDAPWATDANGTNTKTFFTLDGINVTQHIDTTGASYPIVADPTWHWWGYSYALSEWATGRVEAIVALVGAGGAGVVLACSGAAPILGTAICGLGWAAVVVVLAIVGAAAWVCDWYGNGVNINVAWTGTMWCTPR
jgi:hypothetical protein